MSAEGRKEHPRRFSEAVVAERLKRSDYDDLVGLYHDLVELNQVVTSSPRFNSDHPTYGLPDAAFVFVEVLCWHAQAERSGAWTYYDATPSERQRALRDLLFAYAPLPIAVNYAQGYTDWDQPTDLDDVVHRCEPIATWIDQNELVVTRWLAEHARTHAALFLELSA